MIGAPAHTPGRSFRCVLLHPRSRPPRPELMAALARPSFRIFHCDNEFAALAHLCAREGDRPCADEGTILLLVEPGDLDARSNSSTHWTATCPVLPHLGLIARDAPPQGPTRRTSRPGGWSEPTSTPPPPAPPRSPLRVPRRRPRARPHPRSALAGEGTLPAEVSPVQVVGPGVPDPVPDVKPKAQPPGAEAPFSPRSQCRL